MAVRTTTKNSNTAKFEGNTLKTKHQFQAGFFLSSNVLKGDLKKFDTSNKNFFKVMFEKWSDDEHKSVNLSLRKGGAFFVFPSTYNATATTLIAFITFSADENGIWINWLATTMEKYTKEKYGPKDTNESFCMADSGSFLIYLVQLQSAARGWKTDVYLQANKSQETVKFYEKVGFTRMQTNSIEELPEAWH